jgi:hypothetical protein
MSIASAGTAFPAHFYPHPQAVITEVERAYAGHIGDTWVMNRLHSNWGHGLPAHHLPLALPLTHWETISRRRPPA